MNNLSSLLADTIERIYEATLMMLEAQIHNVVVDTLLFEVFSLLLVELFDCNAEVVHGLLEAWRVEVKINSLQLTKFADVRNIVVVFDFGFFRLLFVIARGFLILMAFGLLLCGQLGSLTLLPALSFCLRRWIR
jgi:hypothetical protein